MDRKAMYKMINSKKAVMIGCGFVGSASVFALMQSGLFTAVSYTHLDVYKRQVVTNLGPQNGAFGKLTTLFDKLETPDEKTFVMTLKTPYYAALDNLYTFCKSAWFKQRKS